MTRIHIMGTSGSGKTRLARRLAAALGVPSVELDAVYHGPNWQPAAPERFAADVAHVAAGDAWIVDGNYRAARAILWERAALVLFLDLPRWRVITQLVGRSLGRGLRRTTLWNGNRERLVNLLSRDPSENVVLWGWTRYDADRSELREAVGDPRWSHVTFVRVRSADEAERLVFGARAASERAYNGPSP